MRKLKQHEFNSFTLEKVEVIGIISKGLRYGDRFVYIDIIFEFASWIFA